MTEVAEVAEVAEVFYESEIVDIDSLVEWPGNYNTHGSSQVEALGENLEAFGQVKNIIAWRDPADGVNYIVADHGLTKGAKKKGWKRVEIKRLPEEWTRADVEAVLIADNRLAELSRADENKLADMLLRIRTAHVEHLPKIGYDKPSVDAMLSALARKGEPLPLNRDNAPTLSELGGAQGAPMVFTGQQRVEGQNGATGAAGDVGGDDESERPAFTGTGHTVADVRMVQLFLNALTVVDFSNMTVTLAKRYGTETLTETVLEAVSREYHTGD